MELQNLYIQLDTVLNETFADTASRDYLILRAAERGLSPYAATPAVLELSITPVSLTLPPDTRFSIGDLNYYVSAEKGNGKYEITCETAGEVGNDYGATVIPIEYVVKVYGVENETVNLSFTLTYQQEWSWEDVKTYVETTIKAYFTELAQTWADQEQPLVVRVSQIESRLLAVSGILDIADTKINGTAANYELALDHIPVLGTITPATGKQSA